MSSNFKIAIPEPCNEDWDKMTPDKTGRFCLLCNKSVIDFTNKLPDEIQHFFNKNQNQSICGRFKNSQLDAVSIQIPSGVLFSQTQYHKIFLLALFVVMGTSLFSCATVNGDKQKIEKVQIVDEHKSSANSRRTEQLALENERRKNIIKEDSIRKSPLKGVPIGTSHTMGVMPVSTNHFGNFGDEMFLLPKSENKKIFFKTSFHKTKYSYTNNIEEKNLETEPYFPEGITEFYAFFAKEFKMPENTTLDRSVIIVMIEENGSVTYTKSYTYIDKTVQEEIIRVLKLSPKWVPGKSNGLDIRKKSLFIIEVK